MHGFRRAALVLPDVLDTYLALDSLVADETTYTYTDAEGAPETPDGGSYESGGTHRLVLRFVDASGGVYESLKAYRAAGQRFQVVVLPAVAEGMYVQWLEPTAISALRPVEVKGNAKGRADVYEVVFVTSNPRAEVYVSDNLLTPWGWADANTDNVVDGYTVNGAHVFDAAAGTQQVSWGEGGEPDMTLQPQVLLPFPGETFRLSASLAAAGGASRPAISLSMGTMFDGLYGFFDMDYPTPEGIAFVDAPLDTGATVVEVAPVRVYEPLATAGSVTFTRPVLRLAQ